MSHSTTNIKEIANDFLQLSSSGKSREAFRLYTSPDFKHHNAFFPGDANSLMIAMEENAIKTPEKVLEIQRTLQDGDFVAVHSHVKLKPNDPGLALIHIFRFSEQKIVELWDFGQVVPEKMINENGMF